MTRVDTIKQRADFLHAAKSDWAATSSFHLQGRRRDADEASPAVIRLGVTCSKKVGNAVARNRAKRRLREAGRLILPVSGVPGWDYVLIGRKGATDCCPWADLLRDLETALSRLHRRG